MRLRRGQHVGVPVQSAPTGREDDAADAGAHARLEEVDRAEDVDPRVEQGFGDRSAHVDLRGLVEHNLGCDRGHQRGEALIDDVELVEVGGVRDLLAAASRQVVDDRHLRAGIDQRLRERGADEAGPACDECLHGVAPVTTESTGRGTRTCSTAKTMAPTTTTLP